MPRRFVRAHRERSPRSVHLRLARLLDVGDVAAFCEHHLRTATHQPDRPPAELSALLHGHVDTALVAWRGHEILGVALCGVSRGRARLIELLVEPGAEQVTIERRLLRRTLRNLRSLGVLTLDFTRDATAHTKPVGVVDAAEPAHNS